MTLTDCELIQLVNILEGREDALPIYDKVARAIIARAHEIYAEHFPEDNVLTEKGNPC